jgi:hypothetical protein
MMRDWDEAKYPTGFAATVWGVPVPTARHYVNEYLWLTPNDRKAHVSGATTLLTGRRVLQGAIGAELAPSFRTAALSCEAAKYFTDFSNNLEAPGHSRNPGELFDGALTALAAYPNGEGVVIRVDGARLDQVFFPIGPLGRQIRVVILLLNPIFKRVEIALDKFDHGEEVA